MAIVAGKLLSEWASLAKHFLSALENHVQKSEECMVDALISLKITQKSEMLKNTHTARKGPCLASSPRKNIFQVYFGTMFFVLWGCSVINNFAMLLTLHMQGC